MGIVYIIVPCHIKHNRQMKFVEVCHEHWEQASGRMANVKGIGRASFT